MNLPKNMGSLDRGIRLVFAVVVGVLYFGGFISGMVALILALLAIIFLATSLIGTCPLYMPFGLSTRSKD